MFLLRWILGLPIEAYVRLEVRRLLRNRRTIVFTIALPVILYVLYTAILRSGSTVPVGGLAWPVYFFVSMASYGAMAAAMGQASSIAAERASGWTRHLRVTPLPSWGYLVTKVVAAVVLTVPALLLVAVAAILVNHVSLPVREWAAVIAALALGSLPFAAFGILIGYLLDVDSAQGGMVLAFFTLALLGGLFAPVDTFPSALATVARLLPSYHLADIGRSAVAGQLPDLGDMADLAGMTLVIGGLVVWRYRTVEDRPRG